MTRTQSVLKGKRCSCPTCGEVFSSSSSFDKHRKGEHGINRHCVDPASVGLEIRERGGNTFWTTPMPAGGFTFGARA
jgi:hypothetical protein